MKALDSFFQDGTLPQSPWEDVFLAAENELILPALHSRAQELGVTSRLPTEVSNFLSAVAELNFERNLAIFKEVATVGALLNQVGIEPVLLKGVAYCMTGIYPNPACRYLWDVDLLLPESQLSTAVDVLVQNGFEIDESAPLSRFRHHHPPLSRPGAISFELHHSLGMGIANSLLPASEVLAASLPAEFHGAHVRVLSPDHLLTHLIMHSQIQHPYNERIWPPLRVMYDLILTRRHYADALNWTAIERRFRNSGQWGVLALHLLQVRHSLGSELPFPIALTGLIGLRWFRRKTLRALPFLRFLDPIYMYSTVITRRVRLLRNALDAPGGWQHLVRELVAPSFLKRFITDVFEGRGR